MSMPSATLKSQPSLSLSQIADLRLAASQLTGPKRRAFEAEMTLKYCGGNSLMAEAVFGWGRQTVARGLGERRTGIICLGAQAAFSGRKRWEEQHPHVAQALRQLAEAHGNTGYGTASFVVSYARDRCLVGGCGRTTPLQAAQACCEGREWTLSRLPPL